jgi:hypothetical protein
MKKIYALIILILLIASVPFFQGCATEPISFRIENSLPQSKLAYYSDSFDKLREDFWDKAGYMHSEPVRANFGQANMVIEDGKLRIDTQTGSFSKGGLASRYVIRGDFDIQIDCHIDFLNEWQDMDQVLAFLVIDRGSEIEKIDSVVIGLAKGGGNNFRQVYSLQYINGIVYNRTPLSIGDFHGSLRIVRIGDKITTLYKLQKEAEWRKMNTFRSTPNDVQVGFKLQNYAGDRTSLSAKSRVTAKFDNFKITAAQEIVEEEI